MPSAKEVEAEYSRRLHDRRAEASQLEQRARAIGNVRLLVGISAVVLGFFVFGREAVSPYWLLLPAILFAVLVVCHARVFGTLERARRTVVFYERGLARVEHRWAGTGEQGNRFRDPSHVYAEDLDLFGHGSLYELLCTARTRAGEGTLARWLLAPAAPAEVLARQQAIADLRPGIDLREKLVLAGEDFRSEVHPESLTAWAQRPRVHFPRGTRWAAALITTATLVTFTLYMASVTTRTPFLACLLIDLAFGFALRPKMSEVLGAVESPARDLALTSQILELIEQRPSHAPMLEQLRRRLDTGGLPASVHIEHLERLVTREDWTHDPFFTPIAAVLLWSLHLSVAIEKWRQQFGSDVRGWLEAVADFEALCALASYSYEHPEDTFPEIIDGSPRFEAEQLGHPLMAPAQCVPNDVSLGGPHQLVIVSGSNMSGKSTLLRTVGLNTVLAWAGAPVRAHKLRLTPLQVGASIRILDSLQDGRSRFYAEITRLRQILDLTGGSTAVLFLIDELLSGTNSHDRRIGAEAIVKSLVERGAMGMITTHDLALADIADALPDRAVNLHFADTLENGALHFDYRLHPGVVQRSNALELMRSVGLPL